MAPHATCGSLIYKHSNSVTDMSWDIQVFQSTMFCNAEIETDRHNPVTAEVIQVGIVTCCSRRLKIVGRSEERHINRLLYFLSLRGLLRFLFGQYPFSSYDFRPDIIEASKILANNLLKQWFLSYCAYAVKATHCGRHLLWRQTNLQNRTFAINLFHDGHARNYKLNFASLSIHDRKLKTQSPQ